MVSLNANEGRFQGGYFLDDELMTSQEGDGSRESLAAEHLLLTADSSQHSFRPIRSFWPVLLEALLTLSYTICLFVLERKPAWPPHQPDPPFAFFVVLHAVLWVVVAVIDRIVQIMHQQVRRRGYLDFYRRNRLLRRMPFVVLCTGNALLLILTQFMGCPPEGEPLDFSSVWAGMKRTTVLKVVVCAEILVAFPCQIFYLFRVYGFNSVRAQPDIEEDHVLTNASTQWADAGVLSSANDVGLREGDYLDDVLEKQADMIRYLKQHNTNLARRISALTARGIR